MMIMAAVMILSAKEYKVEIGTFTKLHIPDHLNVEYVCDPAQNGVATFVCEDKLADALMFVNNGKGKLTIEISPDYLGENIKLPTIRVYSEFLTEIESSSEGKVKVSKLSRCPELKVTLYGNGTLELEDLDVTKLTASLMTGHGLIRLEGKADDTLYKVAGMGNIDGSRLSSDKVTCHVFGGGEIHTLPVKELKLKGLGSTTVYYSGSPKVKKQGIGKLVKLRN